MPEVLPNPRGSAGFPPTASRGHFKPSSILQGPKSHPCVLVLLAPLGAGHPQREQGMHEWSWAFISGNILASPPGAQEGSSLVPFWWDTIKLFFLHKHLGEI